MTTKYFFLFVLVMSIGLVSATSQHIAIKTNEPNYDVLLNQGWNGFSILIGNQESTGDRTISLSNGLNLIGYSSPKSIKVKNLIFTNSTSSYTYKQAISNGLLLSINKTQGNDTLGQSALLKDDYLYYNQAYWFYMNGDCNLTFKNVGGSLTNETYKLTDLMFRNSSGAELNITSAVEQGWISATDDDINKAVYYGKNSLGGFSYEYVKSDPQICEEDPGLYVCEITPWEGYFIYGLKSNITMLRQNNITGITNVKKVHFQIKSNDNNRIVHIKIKK